MSDSVSNSSLSNADNLADIVGMSALVEPASISPFLIILLTLLASAVVIAVYYHWMHGFNGQLRHLKYQLNKQQLSPRNAAHKLASLLNNKVLSEVQNTTLKTLRFAPQAPSQQQLIEFINHVV